jgi:hypothetical protein
MNLPRLIALAVSVLLLAGVSAAQPEPAEPKSPLSPAELLKARLKKTGEGQYTLGKVRIDAKARTVICPGKINKPDNPDWIELIAATEKGRLYESLTVLDVEPMDLQLALILLKLKPGRNGAIKYPEGDPDAKLEPGQCATVSLRWTPKAGKPQTQRVEWFLLDAKTKKRLPDVEFVFLSAALLGQGLVADVEGTLVSFFHEKGAIMELAHKRAESVPWSLMDVKRCPPAGTPIELIVTLPAVPEVKPTKEAEKTGAEE